MKKYLTWAVIAVIALIVWRKFGHVVTGALK